jgi:hypothetical protein
MLLNQYVIFRNRPLRRATTKQTPRAWANYASASTATGALQQHKSSNEVDLKLNAASKFDFIRHG